MYPIQIILKGVFKMKNTTRIFIPLMALVLLAFGAWGIASAREAQITRNTSSETELVGTLDNIQFGAWTVSGIPISILPTTELLDALAVGDVVKVHAIRTGDGTLNAREIELANLSVNIQTGGDNSQSQDGMGDGTTSSEEEFYGTVEEVGTGYYIISGRMVQVVEGTELKGMFQVGDNVKVHAWVAADGTLTAREIEMAGTGTGSGDDDMDDDSAYDDDGLDDDSYYDDDSHEDDNDEDHHSGDDEDHGSDDGESHHNRNKGGDD
jgi:hypothetical protein